MLFSIHATCAQKTAIYNETFEESPVGWLGQEDWTIGEGWLKHSLQQIAGVSYFMHEVDTSAFSFKQFEWSADIEMRDYTLSTNNYFRFYLLAGTPDAAATEGLYFMVNGSGANNLSLVEFRSGKTTVLVRGTAIWDKNTVYPIKITYNRLDGLVVFLGGNKVMEVKHIVPQEFLGKKLFSGLMFNYTETRAGKLKADNLMMESSFVQAVFSDFRIIPDRGIELHYTLPIEKAVFAASGNYMLKYGTSVEHRVDSIRLINPFSVMLCTTLQTGNYVLEVKDMTAISGEVVVTRPIVFSCIASVRPGDICINEIMFKPLGGIGLPAEEYIEIYNQQGCAVRLDSVAYRYRGEIADYICDTLDAGGYLILCRLAGVDTLSVYGKAYRIKGFSLLDAGAPLALQTKGGLIIDTVTYRQEWIRDVQKRKGGYSLERIDPAVALPQIFNWYESQNVRGGTPGQENSVYLLSPDTTPPRFVSCTVTDKYRIVLVFSEELYGALAQGNQCYRLNGTDIPDSVKVRYNEVYLQYCVALEPNKPYYLQVAGLKDLSGNTMKDTTIGLFLFAETDLGDILLSEVLYDADPATAEYIELYNNSNKRINLYNIRIGKINDARKLTLLKRVSDSDVVLEPDSLVWICSDPEEIMSRYTYHNPGNYLQISAMLQLSNSEGCVAVLRQDSLVLDELYFHKGLHDPRVIRTKGVALERTDYDLESPLPDAWTSAGGDEAGGYGSPGWRNRSRDKEKPGDKKSFQSFVDISPEIFTPNGDGYEDELQIVANFDEKSYTLRLFICNSAGQPVKKVVNGTRIMSSERYTWNGQGTTGACLLPGSMWYMPSYFLLTVKGRLSERCVYFQDRVPNAKQPEFQAVLHYYPAIPAFDLSCRFRSFSSR